MSCSCIQTTYRSVDTNHCSRVHCLRPRQQGIVIEAWESVCVCVCVWLGLVRRLHITDTRCIGYWSIEAPQVKPVISTHAHTHTHTHSRGERYCVHVWHYYEFGNKPDYSTPTAWSVHGVGTWKSHLSRVSLQHRLQGHKHLSDVKKPVIAEPEKVLEPLDHLNQ